MNDNWQKHIYFVSKYYSQLLDEHGYDVASVDYGRATSQQKKFEILSQVMSLRGKRVLDVGCGFADFADFLAYKHGDLHYEGVDITPEMVIQARRLHPNLNLRVLDIMSDDPGGPYDLVTSNGIFYLLRTNAESYMYALIRRMYDLSQHAVAFNSLSLWADYQEPGEFYADPIKTLAFCRTLSRRITFRHEYMSRDFTIYMYRESGTL
jgi:SAM-dependent methyltransferase